MAVHQRWKNSIFMHPLCEWQPFHPTQKPTALDGLGCWCMSPFCEEKIDEGHLTVCDTCQPTARVWRFEGIQLAPAVHDGFAGSCRFLVGGAGIPGGGGNGWELDIAAGVLKFVDEDVEEVRYWAIHPWRCMESNVMFGYDENGVPRHICVIPVENIPHTPGKCHPMCAHLPPEENLIPWCYEIVVSGVTNDHCVVCNGYNGVHRLYSGGTGCVWESYGFTGCGSSCVTCPSGSCVGDRLWRMGWFLVGAFVLRPLNVNRNELYYRCFFDPDEVCAGEPLVFEKYHEPPPLAGPPFNCCNFPDVIIAEPSPC